MKGKVSINHVFQKNLRASLDLLPPHSVQSPWGLNPISDVFLHNNLQCSQEHMNHPELILILVQTGTWKSLAWRTLPCDLCCPLSSSYCLSSKSISLHLGFPCCQLLASQGATPQHQYHTSQDATSDIQSPQLPAPPVPVCLDQIFPHTWVPSNHCCYFKMTRERQAHFKVKVVKLSPSKVIVSSVKVKCTQCDGVCSRQSGSSVETSEWKFLKKKRREQSTEECNDELLVSSVYDSFFTLVCSI